MEDLYSLGDFAWILVALVWVVARLLPRLFRSRASSRSPRETPVRRPDASIPEALDGQAPPIEPR